VYDVLSGSLTPTFTLENGQASQIWSAEWSVDGRLVSATGKDGVLRLWDVRSDQLKPAMVGSMSKSGSDLTSNLTHLATGRRFLRTPGSKRPVTCTCLKIKS
jgi:coronin-7